MTIKGGRIYEIAPEDLRQNVSQDHPDVFKPREIPWTAAPDARWKFPAGSVTVVELDVS
jgi:alpha-L-arabinofuranosidase